MLYNKGENKAGQWVAQVGGVEGRAQSYSHGEGIASLGIARTEKDT